MKPFVVGFVFGFAVMVFAGGVGLSLSAASAAGIQYLQNDLVVIVVAALAAGVFVGAAATALLSYTDGTK